MRFNLYFCICVIFLGCVEKYKKYNSPEKIIFQELQLITHEKWEWLILPPYLTNCVFSKVDYLDMKNGDIQDFEFKCQELHFNYDNELSWLDSFIKKGYTVKHIKNFNTINACGSSFSFSFEKKSIYGEIYSSTVECDSWRTYYGHIEKLATNSKPQKRSNYQANVLSCDKVNLFTHPDKNNSIVELIINDTQDTIISYGFDGTKIWDINGSLKDHIPNISYKSFFATNDKVLIATEGSLLIYNINSKQISVVEKINIATESLYLLDNQLNYIYFRKNNENILMDVNSLSVIFKSKNQKITINPNRKNFIAIDEKRNILTFYDLNNGKEITSIDLKKNHIIELKHSKTGKYIAINVNDDIISIYDTQTGTKIFDQAKLLSNSSQILWSNNDTILAVKYLNGSVYLIDLNTNKKKKLKVNKNSDLIMVNETDNIIYTINNNIIEAFDLINKKKKFEIHGNSEDREIIKINNKYIVKAIQKSKFNNNNFPPIECFDPSPHIWDAITGKPILSLKNNSGIINNISFYSNNNLLLTSSRDGTAQIWNLQTGSLILHLQ